MDPVKVLQRAYQDELLDALRAEGAAQGVPYPHVRALLLEVARRERAHAEALAEALRRRGASLPPAPKPEEGGGRPSSASSPRRGWTGPTTWRAPSPTPSSRPSSPGSARRKGSTRRPCARR